MRQKTEYASQPDAYGFYNLPSGHIRIDLRENITRETRGENEIWVADVYSIYRTPRALLEADVEENFDIYLALAKAEEKAWCEKDERDQYEREISGALPNVLLDMDYKIMMLEELGGK